MNYWYIPLNGDKAWCSEEPPTNNDRNDANLRIFRLVDLELFEVVGNRNIQMIDESRLIKDPDGNKFTKREADAKVLVANQGWVYV